MQFRPYIIKLRLKSKSWAVKFRPRIKSEPTESFYQKHWRGLAPNQDLFNNRQRPKFFFHPGQLGEYKNILLKRFAAECERIISQADRVLENRYDLLGSGEKCLGSKIDWQVDFKSGFRWPLEHFSKLKIVDLTNGADVKVPWELSRLQFLTTLARGYLISGDDRYKEKFIDVVENWRKENPVEYGVNWTCSMEVAIRAINVIWGLYLFSKDSGDLPDEFIKETIKALYYHGFYIERNLEVISSGSNSNHLLANYVGLFFIGLLFPEFDKASKWLTKGKNGLEKEMLLQVTGDGADYECSTSYHRLVLEIFLSAFILAKANEVSFSEKYAESLAKMVEFSSAMTAQSGKAPAIGDNDDGFIVKLGNEDPREHRPLIDAAAQFIDVKVPSNVYKTEERLWYAGTGTGSIEIWPKMIRRRSKVFRESGYAVVQNDFFHLIFNAAGIPGKSFGGHKHNDILSVNLEINSVPFLIDAGTACYTSDVELRNLSRSTLSHNTITVDECEQLRFFEKKLFYMMNDARPKIELWTVTDDLVLVSGTHDGYSRLGSNLIHRRTIEASLKNNAIVIFDEITGSDAEEHFVESRFLTPWNINRNTTSPEVVIESNNGDTLSLEFRCVADLHVHTVSKDYYPGYGTVAKGNQICTKSRAILPFKLETRLVYKAADSAKLLNRESEIVFSDNSGRKVETVS